MEKEFKFQVCWKTYPEHADIVFEAKLLGDKYMVSWEQDGKIQSTDYPETEVEEMVRNNLWTIIS